MLENENLGPPMSTSEDQRPDYSPLSSYFPTQFKIHEYIASENKVVNTTSLSDDIIDWLRKSSNRQFIFQCLLCCQEMTFKTAFCRGEHYPNRSHLFTNKHKSNIEDVVYVGILFDSSQKFILCRENDFSSGNILNVAKTIKRRAIFFNKNNIQNKVFCENYEIFTLDLESLSLIEIHTNSDIVEFMRENLRPLFVFRCLLCNVKATCYTVVVAHLLGKKHIRKLGGNKGVIVSVKDFYLFITCDINKIRSFLFVDYMNRHLQEIVLASQESIVISRCYTKKTEIASASQEIKIKISPIKLPNIGEVNECVKITNRYVDNNDLTGSFDDSFNKQTVNFSPKRQKYVVNYGFSQKDFEEHSMENILYASFCNGCRMWCFRCRKGIFTLQGLQYHLSSEHNTKLKGNEQFGFMCHYCNIFFIELKGERFYHNHSSIAIKRIIKSLVESNTHAIDYNSPLNKCVLTTYANFLNTVPETCKFCCYACYGMTKQKLMYLSYHEISNCHKKLIENCVFTYCQFCNVIYFDKELEEATMQFKFHFASHINESNTTIHYTVHSTNGVSVDSEVNNISFSFKGLFSNSTLPYNCQKLTIRFSKYFVQFVNPGISSNEFFNYEKWDNKDFSEYLEFYTSLTGSKVELFSCLMCGLEKTTEIEMLDHLFISNHQKNHLYLKETLVKICDICNLVIFSANINDLNEHFIKTMHLTMLSKKARVSSTFTMSFDSECFQWLRKMSKCKFEEVIKNTVNTTKLTFESSKSIFEAITKDVLALLSPSFPDISVTFYGSRVSGLATNESDVDVFLNIGNKHLEEVKNVFKTENEFFKLIVCLSDTSIPLIKAKHKVSGLLCDFNLEKNDNHILINKILKILIDIDERIHWVLVAVRYWAKCTKLMDSNMFSSHAITWFVLFYLMQPDVRIIPDVPYVIEKCGLTNEDNKDTINLDWKPSEVSKDKTWFHLLEEFFNYYFLMKFPEFKLFASSGLVIPRIATLSDEECPMFMQDPVNNQRNILYNGTMEKSEKLAAACFLSLHLPWRWN